MRRVLVSYDVATADRTGRRRLRRVARACCDYGSRVQDSVFECVVSPADWIRLRQRLIAEADLEQDSLRFYFLCVDDWGRREHVGTKVVRELTEPLIL